MVTGGISDIASIEVIAPHMQGGSMTMYALGIGHFITESDFPWHETGVVTSLTLSPLVY